MNLLAHNFVTEFNLLSSVSVNEQELRSSFVRTAASVLEISDLKLERGRQDVRRNHVIIEFKDKGLFRKSTTSAKFKEAKNQLLNIYIPSQAKSDGRHVSDYIGICFDGLSLAFVFLEKDGRSHVTNLVEFNDNSAVALITALKKDDRIELTPQNIIDDFGPSSAIARATVTALWIHLNSSLNKKINKVVMLYGEWQDLFEQSANLGRIGQTRLGNYFKSLGLPQNADPSKALFVLHTYHALIFKLLAAEIVLKNSVVQGARSDYCLSGMSLDKKQLIQSLEHDLEESDLFRQVNILNFIEGTFFSWYLSVPPDQLIDSLRNLMAQINLYRLTDLRLEKTRDVVKRVYQEIVPAVLRHNIGEYFTPEWLAEFTLDCIGYNTCKILTSNYLDPCCGSGNFLIHAIERYKKVASEAGWTSSEILKGIIDHIYGFDLNPLAVLTARINYLIAISDLIETHAGVEIPVYQADAIYAPSLSDEKLQIRSYQIGTQVQAIDIELPEELIQQNTLLGRTLELMEITIRHGDNENAFLAALNKEPQYNSKPLRSIWEPYLRDMFKKMQTLEKIPWDRIWCRIVRNYFASVAVGKCQFIASNPPWVRWSELPPRYTKRIQPTCADYKIFSNDRYFGGNELDISGMVMYTVADKWLDSNKGCLAFIITQTHFQSQSSGGFRRFNVKGTPLQVKQVDDFTSVRPFSGLANKPAVLTLIKGESTKYPVVYNKWKRKAEAYISEESSWSDIEPQLTKEKYEALPLKDEGQRWSILRPGRFAKLSALDGADIFITGRKGIVTDLNGAYFVELLGPGRLPNTVRIRNMPDIGRNPVPQRTDEIEVDLVFPLIKGAKNIRSFMATLSSLFVIIPNKGISGESIPTVDELGSQYPNALRYFRAINASGVLENRSTYRTRIAPQYQKLIKDGLIAENETPFYAIYDIGRYDFEPYKVVWAEMAGTIQAAVISSSTVPFGGGLKPIIPDHKIYFTAFSNLQNAHYVCALLNSEIVREFIDGFTIKLQVGSLFRHIHLPIFNPKVREHTGLSALSQAAHRINESEQETNNMGSIQHDINVLASKILGIKH